MDTWTIIYIFHDVYAAQHASGAQLSRRLDNSCPQRLSSLRVRNELNHDNHHDQINHIENFLLSIFEKQ